MQPPATPSRPTNKPSVTKLRLLGVAAGLVVLGACGGTSEPAAEPDQPAATSAQPAEESSSASASCEDKRGDGKGGDLTSVTLKSDGTELTVNFATAEPIPSSGTALLSVDAWSQDGNAGYQLGVKYDGGQQVAHFVFDHVEANQVNLDGEASTSGTTTTATFPVSEIESLGESFKWSAAYNVAGDDVDFCPNPGRDILNPNQETFPSES